MQTIFEKSQKGQRAYSLPKDEEVFRKHLFPKEYQRTTVLDFPELSELDLTRHFSCLAQHNMCIDTNFYPLGSCTMKLNPRINESAASLPEFQGTHPLADETQVQGNLKLIYDLIEALCHVCGMSAGTVVPNAGAQGEYVGLKMISAYHAHHRQLQRTEILVPDTAHGTNPATVTLAGLKTISVKSNPQGDIDIADLQKKTSEKTAALMLTNPNTLGIFSSSILEIAEIIHGCGALLYNDGANLNAILNVAQPGKMHFDVMHVNLHKTFSTPHGGGGPGAGPVLCQSLLEPFLPMPRVRQAKNGLYTTQWQSDLSIGQVASFYGNFAVCLRAYLYIKLHGNYGLRRIAEQAVLNANYLKSKLAPYFTIPYPQYCMHEFVLQVDRFLDKGIRALDVAKRLLDYGIHAPTIYFPLTLKEIMLIEPTETESKMTLDFFIDTMISIVKEIELDPNKVKTAPHNFSVGRLDEVFAAKHLQLKM